MKPSHCAIYFASVMAVATASGCMDRVDIVGGVVQRPPVAEYLVPPEYNLKGISADGRNLVFSRKQECNAVICDALTGRELLDCSGGNHWIDRDMLFLDRGVGGREFRAIKLSGESPKILWKKSRGLGGYGPRIGLADGIAIGRTLHDRHTGRPVAKQHWPDSYTESFSSDGKLSGIARVVDEDGNTEPTLAAVQSSIPKPFGKKLRVSLWDHQTGRVCWENEFPLPHRGSGGYAKFDRDGEYMIVSVGLRPPVPPGYRGLISWKTYSILLRCKDGALVKEFELGCSARWTADGRGLLTTDYGTEIRYCDKATGKTIATLDRVAYSDSIASSPSGILAGTQKVSEQPELWGMTVWDIRRARQICTLGLLGYPRGAIAISDNGRYLAVETVVDTERHVTVFDLRDGSELIGLHGVPSRRTKNRGYKAQISDSGALAIQWGQTVRVYRLRESRVTQH